MNKNHCKSTTTSFFGNKMLNKEIISYGLYLVQKQKGSTVRGKILFFNLGRFSNWKNANNCIAAHKNWLDIKQYILSLKKKICLNKKFR